MKQNTVAIMPPKSDIYSTAREKTTQTEDKTMTINEAIRTYRLPNPTTQEDLENRFSGMDGKVLTFADKIVITGYYYSGPG